MLGPLNDGGPVGLDRCGQQQALLHGPQAQGHLLQPELGHRRLSPAALGLQLPQSRQGHPGQAAQQQPRQGHGVKPPRQGHHRQVCGGGGQGIRPLGLAGEQPQAEAQAQGTGQSPGGDPRQVQSQPRDHRRGQRPPAGQPSGGGEAEIHPQQVDLGQGQDRQTLGQPVGPASPAFQKGPEDQGGQHRQDHPGQINGDGRVIPPPQEPEHPASRRDHRRAGGEHQLLAAADPRVPQGQAHHQPRRQPEYPLPGTPAPEPQVSQRASQGRGDGGRPAPAGAEQPQGQALELPPDRCRRQGIAPEKPSRQDRSLPSRPAAHQPVGCAQQGLFCSELHHKYHCLSSF